MEKEIYQIRKKETSITVTNSSIESIRTKDITKTGCRVYENGFIGVSGIIGEADEELLANEAKDRLSLKIPYTAKPSSDQVLSVNQVKDTTSSKEVLDDLEQILEMARKEYSDFILSNSVKVGEITTTLKNTQNTNLSHTAKCFSLELIAREKNSINIFDTAAVGIWENWDPSLIVKALQDGLGGYRKKLSLPQEKKMPVIFQIDSDNPLLEKFLTELNGNKIGNKASLLSPYIGKAKFNPNFTLFQDRTGALYNPFFDAEGVICKEYQYPFIEKGIVQSGYTDKQIANKFNLPLTGSASAAYDEVPNLGYPPLNIKDSGKTLKELLNGELGLYVIAASGGDFTPDGHYACPVQLAMLTDGEKFLGRVPEFAISGHLFDLFGDDFIGVSKDKPFQGLPSLVVNMNISSH